MPSCPKCETRYSGAVRICRNCGRDLPSAEGEAEAALPTRTALRAPVSPTTELRVCGHCGLVVPSVLAACDACKVQPIVLPARTDGSFWVRVRCAYPCTQCKALVPFAERCGRCNAEAEHPIMYWRALLAHAQKIWARDGVGSELAEVEGERVRDDDDLPVDFWAGPGHPLCDGCRAPLADDGSCPKCSAPARILDSAIARKVNRALRTIVVTGGKRADRPMLVALTCPSCKAALDVEAGSDQARCRFCGTTSLVNRAHAEAAPVAAFLRFGS